MYGHPRAPHLHVRSGYTPQFTQPCCPWLDPCRSLILKRCVRRDVRGKKKKGILDCYTCSVRSCADLSNLRTLSENVPTGDLEGRNVLTMDRSSPGPQTQGEFGEDGKTLSGWCLVPLNKTITLHAGTRAFSPRKHRYVQINTTITYTSRKSLCMVHSHLPYTVIQPCL